MPIRKDIQPLTCEASNTIQALPGQQAFASCFVDGGVSPYTISNFISSSPNAVTNDTTSVIFESTGSYTINLTVTDGAGQSVTCRRDVSVSSCQGGYFKNPMR